MVNTDFFNNLKDAYLATEQGRGVFLAGVAMGYIARCQVKSEGDIKNAPLFKQIQFGRMDFKALKRMMARIPQLTAAYSESIRAPQLVNSLAAEASKMILTDKQGELGVDGNFAFTTGFINGTEYFWKIFKKESKESEVEN